MHYQVNLTYPITVVIASNSFIPSSKRLARDLVVALSHDDINDVLLLLVMHAGLKLGVVYQVPAAAPVAILKVAMGWAVVRLVHQRHK